MSSQPTASTSSSAQPNAHSYYRPKGHIQSQDAIQGSSMVPSPAIQHGADVILQLIESEKAAVAKNYERELSSLRYTNEQLLLQYTKVKTDAKPEVVSSVELETRLHLLQKQFDEYRVSTAKELNAAVTAAKTDSGDVLKGISKRLGEKEAQMNALNMALDRAGLCQDHQGLLRFSGEWQSFVEGLLRMPDGQTTVPLEQYPLDPCSLLRFLQNTHKTYLSTVRHMQEKCTAAEKERDELRVLLANSQVDPAMRMQSLEVPDGNALALVKAHPSDS
ncbi:hypothetical protein PLEOSDRAFT_154303 [Pleurotus ostreatus PC15]|uniref:Uncharacterized protein n=1 Tax=Pleurotus ostreatus (strain PC15) TaxID=1137138 RepID=A0A067NW01_PLEO1|nr:hypothetical protein PLEOSDRAFT_154303 [Pleurotus ostreatus PC15]